MNLKDIKIKGLKPTKRLKKRFILIKYNQDKEFNEISKYLIDKIRFHIGAIDLANHAVWSIKDYFDKKNKQILIKCSTKIKDKVISAILLSSNNEMEFSILKVSATLKGIRNYKNNINYEQSQSYSH